MRARWPGYRHVVFDCDSTLTKVEGIDELARAAGQAEEVRRLTNAAMSGEAELDDVFGPRVEAADPTRGAVLNLLQLYKRHVVADAEATVAALQELGHGVYIVSGGLLDAVMGFAVHLGVPEQNVRAVGIDFDRLSGRWWERPDDLHASTDERYLGFARGDLTTTRGKQHVVAELLAGRAGGSLLVGDGVSDLMATPSVDLVAGFGGVVERSAVALGAGAYIRSQSISPVLPLAVGPVADQLDDPQLRRVFDLGVRLANEGSIEFRDPDLARRFAQAFELDD